MLQTLLFLTVIKMTDYLDAPNNFSIEVEENFTGEAGLCIRVFCSFTFPQSVSDPIKRTWFKGDPQNSTVEVPYFSTNTNFPHNYGECYFLLNHLVQGESDGEYRLKLEWGEEKVYIFPQTVNITVKAAPKILNSSHCFVWGDKLSCMCVSSGVPLPKIYWPILNGTTKFCSAVSTENIIRISNISIPGFSNVNATIECVSENLIGTTKMEIQVHNHGEKHKESWSLSTPWILFTLSVILNVIFAFCLTVALRRRERHKKPKDDNHVYMTAMKRDESVYETTK